ncbi:MAG: hypothetical protein LBC68_02550 [Prevotellaceae bacterium]|jgi:uncharacterized membrane protein|nr:hypothetical protein [Prevotellaceae bacterium]
MEILIALIALTVLWAIISGIIAIVKTWRYCIMLGKSSVFLSYVFQQMGGNLITIIGIIILCIPIWILLSIVVAVKKKSNPAYYKYVQLMSDNRYIAAFDLCVEEYRQTNSWDTAKAKGVEYLVNKNIQRDVAAENMNLIIMIRILSQIQK